eukprot:1919609-Pyramimonas_sp.AAC.1
MHNSVDFQPTTVKTNSNPRGTFARHARMAQPPRLELSSNSSGRGRHGHGRDVAALTDLARPGSDVRVLLVEPQRSVETFRLGNRRRR